MEYAILEADSTAGLEKKVREMIEEGWRPLGGVAVYIQHSVYALLFQAMVRGQ